MQQDPYWPEELSPIHVITIDPKRAKKFVDRCANQGLRRHVAVCQGVDGRGLNKKELVKSGKVHRSSVMTRGQIGCFESHRILWQRALDMGMPYVFIVEDDTYIMRSERVRRRLRQIFGWLRDRCPDWEALFLTRSTLKRYVRRMVGPGLGTAGEFWGLNAYVLSLNGVKKVLEDKRCRKYSIPCDVVLARMARHNQLKAFVAAPCVFPIIPETSSTNGIS